MSFGYSVGDFIAVTGLIHNVIRSLNAAGGARAVYRELCVDLEGLKNTLDKAQSLELEGRGGEMVGLKEACGACLDSIYAFLGIMHKFESTLKHSARGGWVYEVKKFWHKIDLGVLREDQVRDFKASLATPLQRAGIELGFLLWRQGNFVRGTQDQHSELLLRILGVVEELKHGVSHDTTPPPAYKEHTSKDTRLPSLSSPPPTTKKVDNVLKELRMIGTRFAASQGNLGDIDKEVVNVIKHTSAAYESLQKEAENLNWSELPKVLEMLPGILGTYNEDLFRNLPTETKKHVVNAMGKALESSLDFTDQTIALLQEHQRESTRKGVDSMGDMQQYLRASRCVTSLAHVASQFEGFVSRSGSDIKPWPQEDFESKTCNTSIEYNEDVIPRFSYSGKVSKGFGLAVDEALPRSTNFLDASDLLAACQDREIDLLEQHLKTPAINLDAIDDKGNGVLHLALGTGKVNSDKSKMANIVNIVRLLCTHDANINAPDKSGLCPIHYCAQTINSEAAKCILDRGARINEPDLKGRTALYYVAVDGHPDVEFAKMLIRNGAKLGTAKLPKLPPRANESQKKVRLLVMKR